MVVLQDSKKARDGALRQSSQRAFQFGDRSLDGIEVRVRDDINLIALRGGVDMATPTIEAGVAAFIAPESGRDAIERLGELEHSLTLHVGWKVSGQGRKHGRGDNLEKEAKLEAPSSRAASISSFGTPLMN